MVDPADIRRLAKMLFDTYGVEAFARAKAQEAVSADKGMAEAVRLEVERLFRENGISTPEGPIDWH